MKIVFIASECFPFAKTGGLADVVGALPPFLKKLGHDVIVVIPKYASLRLTAPVELALGSLGIWMGDRLEWCTAHRTSLKEDVPVYLIEFEQYFGRDGIYHDAFMNDYQDNPRRFAFLSRAALQLCKDIDFQPDVVHVHDWQSALASAYLKIWHWDDPILGSAASMLTIHNIGYQGVYSAQHYNYMGLQRENFITDRFEDHGHVNMLKGGIYFADLVNTVSPTYADETRTPGLAWGLAPYLNNKGSNYFGILNGVDYAEWNPETDLLITARYSVSDISGKKICKQALQRQFQLTEDPNIPIVGVVSRFADQKGLDLLAQVIENIVTNMIVQFVILGSGEKTLEDYFGGLPARYPGQIGSYIGYHNELSHWIEAGSDFFIMPSRYEPCGLNQIYSLKYGTLPIVRATGGLVDTVDQYNEATGEGTGFLFQDASPTAVYYATGWAVSTYYDRPAHIQQMMKTAMQKDFSWEKTAQQYVDAYKLAIENKKRW